MIKKQKKILSSGLHLLKLNQKRQMKNYSTIIQTLEDIRTPAFIVDLEKVTNNCNRMIEKSKKFNLSLRPHVKTHKTIQGALLQTNNIDKKIVVSTLSEANFFSEQFNDIHYAVPITSNEKLYQVLDLTKKVEKFHIEVDNEHAFKLIENFAKLNNVKFNLFVQVDSGQHRVGLDPNDESSISLIKQIINSPFVSFSGLYTHAGHSYSCKGEDEIRNIAKQEANAVSNFANQIKEKLGYKVKTVAVGSTPTCSIGDERVWSNSSLVNEIHPGNYVFYDYMQTKIGSCTLDDCSSYVLSTIIGVKPKLNQFTIDAGALSLSKDIGVSDNNNNEFSYGYIMEDDKLKITGLTQEIGIVSSSQPIDFEKFNIGKRIRIIPNHSCLSAALFEEYQIINNSKENTIIDQWKPNRGW
ncbi:hypothetical protein ABK040_005907 [Willaertia magna]